MVQFYLTVFFDFLTLCLTNWIEVARTLKTDEIDEEKTEHVDQKTDATLESQLT